MPIHATILTGAPRRPIDLVAPLAGGLQAGRGRRVRFGFAYATESGLDVLLEALDRMEAWNTVNKLWILGLHHGITEPVVIQRIRALPNSRVRLFVGDRVLSYASLTVGPRFHAKAICLDSDRADAKPCVVASSANLTGAALGPAARNYEAGTFCAFPSRAGAPLGKFDRWWDEAWRSSLGATDRLVERYAELRGRLLRKNPDLIVNLDPPSRRRIGQARVLWIEAGAMSGGSRNQVEFNRDLAGFFGPVRSSTQYLRMSVDGRVWDDRPLSPKTTTFGVDIWRLSLPTTEQSGLTYAGRVIRVQRGRDDGRTVFELDVADLDSPRYRRWWREANRRGYLGQTSGDRNYGVL